MSSVPEPVEVAVSPESRRRQRLKLLLILAICASPVIASYFVYYVVRPVGRTNYGDLIEPQQPAGHRGGQSLGAALEGGELSMAAANDAAGRAAPDPGRLAAFHGRWVMLLVQQGACDDRCARRLWVARQVRLTTGKDQERVERVLLLARDAPLPPPAVLAEHPGLHLLRADGSLDWLPLPADDPASTVADHLYMVDPLGNLMLRFPRDADPSRMKKDLAKLLRASRVG